MLDTPPAGLLPISQLAGNGFQRRQLNPTKDYLFGDTPCLVAGYQPPCPTGGADPQVLALEGVSQTYVLLTRIAFKCTYFVKRDSKVGF